MSYMKTYIIHNPNAGSSRDIHDLLAALRPLGNVHLQTTTAAPGSARALAGAALNDGAQMIVAAGGDGTISEVVNGMATDFSQARLGIIPLGTANDFARSINIPTDVDAAIEMLVAAQTETLDLIRVTTNTTCYSLNVSTGGFSGIVDAKLTEEMKRSWGPLAYLRSAVEALPGLTSYRTSITFDDEEAHELETYNIVIANACYVAGGGDS